MRLVSTTSRTEPPLSPLLTNRVYFGLDLFVRHFRARAAASVTLGHRELKSFGEKTVHKGATFLGREFSHKVQ
jgi:hypothetical protein